MVSDLILMTFLSKDNEECSQQRPRRWVGKKSFEDDLGQINPWEQVLKTARMRSPLSQIDASKSVFGGQGPRQEWSQTHKPSWADADSHNTHSAPFWELGIQWWVGQHAPWHQGASGLVQTCLGPLKHETLSSIWGVSTEGAPSPDSEGALCMRKPQKIDTGGW